MLVNPTSAGSRCSGHFLKRSVGSAFLFSRAAQYELFFPSPFHLPRSSFLKLDFPLRTFLAFRVYQGISQGHWLCSENKCEEDDKKG